MPVVLKRSKAVFLHIPKTGGTWLRFGLQQALVPWDNYGLPHTIYDKCRDVFPAAVRFTIVRNPFDWYASYWADRCIQGWGGDLQIGHTCAGAIFPDFIRRVTIKHPGWLRGLYSNYIRPDVRVLKLETIKCDLERLLEFLGEQHGPLDVSPVNEGASLKSFRDRVVYDKRLAKEVIDSEGVDFFRQYGYSTEPPHRSY